MHINDSPGDVCDFDDFYREVVEGLPSNTLSQVVEVGSFIGRSAILMANHIRNSHKPIAFFVVDHFKGSNDAIHQMLAAEGGGSFRALFEKNLTRAGVRKLVTVFEGDSAEMAKNFADASLDFVFIDAEHTFERVMGDIKAWLPKVKPGGILAGHDFNWIQVKAAVMVLLPDAQKQGPASWIWRKPCSS